MQIKPAKLEYVQQGLDGRTFCVSSESSTVAADLKQHDPCLQLHWLQPEGQPPAYAVFRIHINGRPCEYHEMRDVGLEPEFILSAMECDQRIVDRIRQIDVMGRGDYRFAEEVERQNREAERQASVKRRERIEEHGEELAYAIRKDMGWRYRGRTFVPRDMPNER